MSSQRTAYRRVDVLLVLLLVVAAGLMWIAWVSLSVDNLDRLKCENQQGKIAKSIGRYETSKRRYPGYDEQIVITSGDAGTQRQTALHSWVVASLELLSKEQFEAIRDELNTRPVELKLFQCPANRREGAYINYVGNCGRKDATDDDWRVPPDWKYNGVFMSGSVGSGAGERIERVIGTDIADGATHTLLISENLQAMRWTDTDEASIGFVWFPVPNPEAPDPPSRRINVGRDVVLEASNYDYARPSSWHPDGVVVAYCDGRTEFMADTIDYRVYCQLMTPNGAQAMEPGEKRRTIEMYRR